MSGSRILIIVHHRKNRSPGQRYRIEQYLEALEAAGHTITFSNLLNEKDDKDFYAAGNIPGKVRVLLKCAWIRTLDMIRAHRYSHIYVYREAFPLGSTFFERAMKALSRAKLIFDFDDAIWIPDVSEGNRKFAWMKDPGKTAKLSRLADTVSVGNQYLAAYAKQFNQQVVIIPSTIDMQLYSIQPSSGENDKICIGWSGSPTTIQHFKPIIPVLKKLKEKFPQVAFCVLGDPSYSDQNLIIQGIQWTPEKEVPVISGFDIGIMPLPDNEWAKGKCGMKGLQYMALGIPTILADVGTNKEIIQDGLNGFLAQSEEEWFDKLSLLITDIALRKKLGEAGKQTVIERYSTTSQLQKYFSLFS